MQSIPDPKQPLSEVLLEIAESAGDSISLNDLMSHFGGRALGALLLIFGLLCMLPLPPGGTTIFGLPLVLFAPQLMIGARQPWLPKKLRERSFEAAGLREGLTRAAKTLKRMEAVSRPRLTFVVGGTGERVIGLVCLLLALVLILPIPLGNILPATAVTVLAFSLIQRDGAVALVGHAIAAASAGVLILAAHIIVRMAVHLWTVVTGA